MADLSGIFREIRTNICVCIEIHVYVCIYERKRYDVSWQRINKRIFIDKHTYMSE